jgi:hypothetical protein
MKLSTLYNKTICVTNRRSNLFENPMQRFHENTSCQKMFSVQKNVVAARIILSSHFSKIFANIASDVMCMLKATFIPCQLFDLKK